MRFSCSIATTDTNSNTNKIGRFTMPPTRHPASCPNPPCTCNVLTCWSRNHGGSTSVIGMFRCPHLSVGPSGVRPILFIDSEVAFPQRSSRRDDVAYRVYLYWRVIATSLCISLYTVINICRV